MSVLLGEGDLSRVFESAHRRGPVLDTALFFEERPLAMAPALETKPFDQHCRFVSLPHMVLRGIDSRGKSMTPDYMLHGPAAVDAALLKAWHSQNILADDDIFSALGEARERAQARNAATWSAFTAAQQRGSFASVISWQQETAETIISLRHGIPAGKIRRPAPES